MVWNAKPTERLFTAVRSRWTVTDAVLETGAPDEAAPDGAWASGGPTPSPSCPSAPVRAFPPCPPPTVASPAETPPPTRAPTGDVK